MRRTWQAVLGIVLPVLAILVTGVALSGVVRPKQPQVNPAAVPRFMETWEDATGSGLRIGPEDAPVRIVVFSDLQCDYCSQFHRTLTKVMRQHPGDVSYTFIHFPLSRNRESVAAARLVECAGDAGRASKLIDVIFANQDSLPTQNWVWFARAAAIDTPPESTACMSTPGFPDMVTRGLAMGAWMSVRGTPVVILNGWRFSGAPDDTAFVRAVSDIINGRDPYPNPGGVQATAAGGVGR